MGKGERVSCAFVGRGFSESLASASRCDCLGREAGREAGFTGSLTMHVTLGAAELPPLLLGGGQAVRMRAGSDSPSQNKRRGRILALKSSVWCASAISTPAQVPWVKGLSPGLERPLSCQGKPS